MLQECLGDNNRDWRLCQKGFPASLAVCCMPAVLHVLGYIQQRIVALPLTI